MASDFAFTAVRLGVVHQVDFSFVGEKLCIAETPFACCGQEFLGLFDLSSLRRVCQAQ
jgi:hypothetical protein